MNVIRTTVLVLSGLLTTKIASGANVTPPCAMYVPGGTKDRKADIAGCDGYLSTPVGGGIYLRTSPSGSGLQTGLPLQLVPAFEVYLKVESDGSQTLGNPVAGYLYYSANGSPTDPAITGTRIVAGVTSDTRLQQFKDGSVAEFRNYSSDGSMIYRKTKITDSYNNITQMVRNSSGLLQQIIAPNGEVIQFKYAGKLTGIDFPNGKGIEFKYDPNGRLAESKTLPSGITQYISYYPGTNLPYRMNIPAPIEFSYDSVGHVLAATNYGKTSFNTVKFDYSANSYQITDPAGMQTTYYLNNEQLVRVAASATTPGSQPYISATDYTWATIGGQRRIVRTASIGGGATNYVYDAMGFLKRQEDLKGNRDEFTYTTDPFGGRMVSRITSTLNNVTNTVNYFFDSAGFVTSIRSVAGIVNYVLNPQHDPVQVTVNGKSSYFGYTSQGLIAYTRNIFGMEARYDYDSKLYLKTVFSPRGDVVSISRDGFNRATNVNTSNSPVGDSNTALTYAFNGFLTQMRKTVQGLGDGPLAQHTRTVTAAYEITNPVNGPLHVSYSNQMELVQSQSATSPGGILRWSSSGGGDNGGMEDPSSINGSYPPQGPGYCVAGGGGNTGGGEIGSGM